MEDGGVSGGQISASSELSPNHAAVQGRLNFLKSGVKEGAWTAGSNNGNQWLQIYFGNQTLITGVATQGRSGACHWVTKYNLQYSDYGVNFAYYTEQDRSSKKEFVGNTDQNTIVYHELKPPIRARYIRFRPVAWYVGVSMRVELYGCFQECIGPLGMEDGALSDDKITASTDQNGHRAIQGRLHFPASNLAGAWAAARNDINQWLQIYLGNRFANITGVATQGRDQVAYWVKTYNLQYGNDELSLQYYSEQGQSAIKKFDGNTDWKSIVYHELQPPVIARFIRIRPVSWHGQIQMRAELYGCIKDEDECQNGAHNCSVNEQCINTFGSFNCTCLQGYSEDGVQCSAIYCKVFRFTGIIEPLPCHKSLGMEDGGVSGGQISASSELSPNHAAVQGRLKFLKSGVKEGAWTAGSNNGNQWLQIYLGNQTLITGVATQGRSGACHWVTKYNLQYSDYGVNFAYYTEQDRSSKKEFVGNTDQNTIVYHELKPPIRARYIRFRPVAWYVGVSMRVELYGCFQECIGPLGMEDGELLDDKISASTEIDGHRAFQGRLHFPASSLAGAWAAARNDINQWLQIYLSNRLANITGVATQGRDQVAQWVTMYNLQYGNDELSLQYYSEQGQSAIKTFDGNTDWKSIVYHELQPSIIARFIRIRPVTWYGHISMRVELYGCIEDKDECQNGTHNCSMNAQCINTFGSFNCSCLQGYLGDGVQCTDLDECKTGTHDCDVNAQCDNIIGSYNCTCLQGYSGDGLECYECQDALGMENREITDGQITASSQADLYHAAIQGRLHFPEAGGHAGGWVVGILDDKQWLQVDLKNKYANLTGVATQGRSGFAQWVTKYNLQYSDDGVNFYYYMEQGHISIMDFVGNTDQNTVVYHEINPPITARYIRFRPVSWYARIAMRVELYGCIKDEDECDNGRHNCSVNAQCYNTFGSFNCTCLEGYSGDGVQCPDLDECQTDTHDCDANAQCGNSIGSYNCTCLQGYTGNGLECYDVEECQNGEHNCDVNAQCNNTFGSFNCTCLQGYEGDGVHCFEVDECQNGEHNCDVNAQCSNMFGSFNCTCLQGYVGDGMNCSDVDECQNVEHNCDDNAQCNNTFGSFNCTCLQGYEGDGVNCSDADECQNGEHNCDGNAQCNNTFGSFNCTCLQGYGGDGVNCSDLDECQNAEHNCDVNAQCNNMFGSFNCTCLPGYEGDGMNCSDIDECATTTHNCHGVANCYNNEGSFTCRCQEYYTGDGLYCEPMGDFPVTIGNISKDRYHATPVERSAKRLHKANIEGLPESVIVLESVLEWRLVSEIELLSSAEGALVSEGTEEWTINRRSIPVGIYQVKFTASLTIYDSAFLRYLRAFDYGFIEITAAPIRVIIDGGKKVRWGSNENVTVNGSLSYDRNIGPGDPTGLNFTWSCRDSAANASMTMESVKCIHSLVEEANVTSSVNIRTSQLEAGKTYVLRLTVTKDERSSFAEMSFELVDGRIPHVFLRCFVDCGPTISPSNKFRVASRCVSSACSGAVYEWRLKKWNGTTKLWQNLPILPNMTSTEVNAANIVFNKNALPSDSKFSLMLSAKPQTGKINFAVLDFYTEGEPHGGYCEQSDTEGVSLETEFSFECFEWQDENTPITYEFRLGDELISYGISSKSVPTVLPAGSQDDDHKLQINIVIKNAVSVAVVETLLVKVKPSPKFDPCISSAEVILNELQTLVLGNDSKLDVFLRKGEINKAAQLAISVLKAVNYENSDCGQALNQGVKTLISRKLIAEFADTAPESIQMSRVIMTVLNLAIEDQQGQSCEGSQNTELNKLFQDLAMKLIDDTTKKLVYALEDIEEPSSAELEETAAGITRCIKNVLWSASCTIQDNGTLEEIGASSNEVSKKALQKLNTMTGAFFSRLVASEALVINIPNLQLVLKKVATNDLKGLVIEGPSAKFKLPENFVSFEEENINIKMMAIEFNPFTWDKTSKMVKSSVISLELKNSNAEMIKVSHLDSDIEMIIPMHGLPMNTNNMAEYGFLKPNIITTHSYYAELAGVPVSLKLGAQVKDIAIEIFVKFGSRPTIQEFDYNFVVQFKSTCESQTNLERNETSCPLEETSVTLVPSEPGLLYVGLLFLGAKNASEHSRKRRSCFGRGRERRSCVDVKDPPPKGVYKKVVLQYDPITDVNYTLSITQSSCLYWSEGEEKWSSYGCKVDPSSNASHLKCLCNHLTFFGGNFIQAPNAIDFDKVLVEFTRIDESGHISVLVTVAIVFLLYFVVLVFARRADKRDENKICPPRHVTIAEEGTYFYDLVISTGVWKNSGTTANVTISINGKINEHNLISLRGKGESRETFSRGAIDGFVLITDESIGSLTEIALEHDNSGKDPSWFIETVTIRDRQTNEQWVFPINRWLALDKDDGEIEITAETRSHISFSEKLRLYLGRKLVDSHLWLSVIGKACCSTFTRAQRASCCLSLLFSAMIASAMFYNFGRESDGAIQVGPFKFSWKQIVVGVQSGIIVAPVNLLIVFMFKYSRPRRKTGHKQKETDQDHCLVDKIRGQGCMLPHFCVYVGWFLCFVTTLTGAFFTLLYGFTWGKETSEQWLASFLISFSQDILVLQPTKAMLAVILIALLLSRNRDHREACDGYGDVPYKIDIDLLNDDPKRRFKRYKLEAMRERTKKEAQLTGMVKKVVLHLVFLFFLAVVCYGNKNENRFLMTTAMRNPIKNFSKVTDSHRLWEWLKQEFLPSIYNQAWYNGLEEEKDLYIGNKKSILIGMPWMRQLRVKNSSCSTNQHNIPFCYYDYSREGEDTTLLRLPGWKPLPHNTSWSEALTICPKPWRYQTAEELNIGTIKAPYNTYGGGGYPAVLGYDEDTAYVVLNETLGQGWVDRQTRAVILEFAVFNVNTNLISIAVYFYEVLATGAAFLTRRIETLELYSTDSGAVMFYLICQFLFLVMVLYHFIILLIHLNRQRLGFFKSVWNMIDFVMIISSISSVALYMIRSKSVLNSIQTIQKNPFDIVHFHTALDWANLENASIAVAIFMATLKLLNLIRFNPHVIYLFLSFRQSVEYQLSYVGFFLIIFHAFVISGMQFFGRTVYSYSSYMQAVVSQFEFLLGKAVPIDKLRNENPFLGPTFAFLYMLITTILFMNMIVSVLNESYAEAKAHAEESAAELEMAHFVGERLDNFFGLRSKPQIEMKLFCDDSTYLNMCISDAEPFCLNSQNISQCTEERMERLEKRIFALSQLTKNMEFDYLDEEFEFTDLLHSIIEPDTQTTHL
ncbi:polycystin family receptor for egg jelly-like [Oculina patagonica]